MNEPKLRKFADVEERALVRAIESGKLDYRSVLTPKRRAGIEAMARATMNDVREKITIRIAKSDLVRLKSRALREGIPYQTLINSIIHKFVTE